MSDVQNESKAGEIWGEIPAKQWKPIIISFYVSDKMCAKNHGLHRALWWEGGL